MPYRTDARAEREPPPDWLVQGNRRSQALAFLIAACVLGVFGVVNEHSASLEGGWRLREDGAIEHVEIPGFDPGLMGPAPSCRYFIPYPIGPGSYCGTVMPTVIPRDPLLGCPSPDELRILWGFPYDQPIERLEDPAAGGIE